jgi:hypothetical protein
MTTTVAAADRAQTIEQGPLNIVAAIAPSSINVEARTAEVIFYTGAPIRMYDWDRGEPYLLTFSLKPSDVRLDRLRNGAPFLDAHHASELSAVLGAVESARIEKGQAVATVRFSKRAEVEPIWQDIKDRIIRNVSVGANFYKFEQTEATGTTPMKRHATDWEPFEISAVPIGADPGAKIKAADTATKHACVIVRRQELNMAEDRSETIAADNPMMMPASPLLSAPAATSVDPPEPNERDEGAAAENERCEGIRSACLAAKMPRSFEDKLIRDRSMSLVKAQGLVLDELRKRGGDDRGPRSPSGASEIIVGDDPFIHVRAGIEGALLHRVAPHRFPLDDRSRHYRGMSLLDVGRAFLNARGVRTSSLDRSRLVDALMVRAAGLHTTTDFPGLFEDAANKNLRAAYEAAPQTWLTISRLVTLTDFKPSRQLQVGDAPALLEILEHGEYTFGTIGEAKETIQLKTYGRMFGITRQALINDDLNAFGEVPAAFGRKARDIESDLAWAQITTNPTMGDGVALFHAGSHFNLTSSGTVISVASLGVGRAALRNQKGIDAVTPLNLSPSYLIVPAALETIADQFVTQITPAVSGSVNPFAAAGRTPLTTIVGPRLDVNSATAWYMATNVSQAPLLYHGVLDGQEGPLVTQMEGFDVDGMKFRCRIDVAFKAADWRAAYKNVGA